MPHLLKQAILGTLPIAFVTLIAACESAPPHKSDAELGLTTQQVRGRRVYDLHCLECHAAYVGGGRHGPSMKGVFRKKELPSGAPANDQRVSEVILQGRSKMAGFGNRLTREQLNDLLAYMHTL